MGKKKVIFLGEVDDQTKDLISILASDYKIIHVKSFAGLNVFRSCDCVVIDLQLNNCRSIEFMKRIRRRLHRLPIICITDLDNEYLINDALKYGAFYFIQKPIEGNQLGKIINDALNCYGGTDRQSVEFMFEEFAGMINRDFES